MTYFNYGIRSGGGIGDLLENKFIEYQSIYWIRWVSDMLFYVSIILLVLNMINGIIITTFSSIREENDNKEEDINNKCFICSLDRVEFEKRKVSFVDHCKKEHCVRTYITYLISTKLKNPKDLDADENYVLDCIKKREISCFPVGVSLRLNEIDKKGNAPVESDDEDD
jgi:hypothetical protein